MSTRSALRYFKIFVKDSGRPSISLLEYIHANIDIINEMGVKIKIAKLTSSDLDKEMVEKLAAKGILRFPALVTDENKVKLGVEKIQNLFEGNKRSYNHHLVSQSPPTKESIFLQDFAEDKDLAEYYQKEMNLDAMERDRSIGESDGFEAGASDEFNRRVSEQLNARKINPGGSKPAFDMEALAARRQNSGNPTTLRTTEHPRRIVPREHENIASDTLVATSRPPKPAPGRNNESLSSNSSFDDSMFDRAFTEGLGGEYY